MNAARPANILRQLERADGAPSTDADLLARFVATKDADAFAELVRRHGSCVLGVCRRVTGQAQDAEDAFQATFLVLAKKAVSLRTPELLGNYVYGVAFRVALRAKRGAARRRAREVLVPALPDPPAPSAPPAMPELLPILDEELAALPACYREAIILCDLRGQSREAAAAALGVPEGTVSSRLATGRKKLAARLTRRGVTLSTAAVPVALAEARAQAMQPIPNELITKTCGLVADWASGAAVPTPLARLASGGFNVRKMLALGTVMVMGVAGAVFAATPRDGAPPVDPPKPPVVVAAKADAPPKEEPKAADKAAVTFTTTPRMQRALDLNLTGLPSARWNATGTHLAVLGTYVWQRGAGDKDGKPVVETKTGLRVLPVDGQVSDEISYPGSGATLAAALPDGSGFVTALREYHLISGRHHLRFVLKGEFMGNVTWGFARTVDLDLPETHGYAFAPDGKTYRTVAFHRDAGGVPTKLEVLEVSTTTGKAVKSLLKIDHAVDYKSTRYHSGHVLSANGKRLAVLDKGAKRVTVYDLDRGEKVSSAELAEPAGDLPAPVSPEMSFMDLSPDGRRLVVSRGIGRFHVLNADTGEALPGLEGTKHAFVYPDANAFTGDGRLFAAIATVRQPVTKKTNFGKEQTVWEPAGSLLGVWDTQTGKALKTWRGETTARPAFNPARPLLAILESNGESSTRVGFWDFAAEVEKK
jgi:RNA polymerase sigma factor (sigma-70 family)